MADGRIVIDVIMNDGSVKKGVADIAGLTKESKRAGLSLKNMVGAGLLIKGVSTAMGVLKNSVGSAVQRFDTLQKFPKVMKSLGFTTEQSAKASKRLSDGIDGLPTTLQEVVANTQRMTAITGDLDKSTDATIAMNNAFLASGASTDAAARGMDQYMKMVSTGKVELDSWTTLQETMPLALQKTAEAMGFVGKTAQNDLYSALKSGTVTFDQFQDQLIKLGTGTGQLADLAKKNSLGIGTSFKNLQSSITKGLANVLTKFDEIVQKLTGKSIAQNIDNLKGIINNTFSAITKGLDNLIPLLGTLGNFISKHTQLFKALGVAVGTFIASFAGLSAISGTLSAITKVFSMFNLINPFTLVIGGLSALVAVIFHFYNTSKSFKAKIDGMVKSLKDLSKPIDTVLKGINLLTKGFIEMITNGPGKKIEELRSQFSKLFPESLWQGMITFTGKINDLKLGIQAIGKIISGSIKNFGELDSFLAGAFGEKGERNILKIGKAVKGVIDGFKNLINPSKQAGKSIDIFGIALKVLKSVFLASLGPFGLVIKAFELVAKVIGNGSIGKGIDQVLTSFDDLATGIKKNAPLLGKSFGKALQGILLAIGNALPGIISGGLRIVSGFISGIAQGLPQLALAAAQLITAFTGTMLLLLPTIVTSATSIIVAFLGALTMALPQLIVAGAGLISALLQGVTQQLPTLVKSAANLIVTWLNALNQHMPEILQAGFNLLITFLQGIASNIGRVGQQALNIVLNFAKVIVQNMPKIVNTAVDLMVNFTRTLAGKMPDIVDAAATLIVNFINGIASNLGRIIDSAVNLIVAFLGGITRKIPDVVNAAMNLVDAMVLGILQAQGRLMDAAINLINGFANNIRNRQGDIRSAGLNLLSALVGVFVPDSLFNAGLAIIDGFLNGLKSGFEKVKDFVGGIADWIRDHKGPISYDKKLLIANGKAIMQSLNSGILAGFKYVQKTITGITDKLSDGVGIGLNMSATNSAITLPKITPEAALGAYGRMASTSSVVNNYYTTHNSKQLQPQTYQFEATFEVDGKAIAKGTAVYLNPEINRINKLNARKEGRRI